MRERAGASAARNEKWAAIDDRTSVWFFVFRFPGRGAAFLWATIFLRSVSGYGCVCVCVSARALVFLVSLFRSLFCFFFALLLTAGYWLGSPGQVATGGGHLDNLAGPSDRVPRTGRSDVLRTGFVFVNWRSLLRFD